MKVWARKAALGTLGAMFHIGGERARRLVAEVLAAEGDYLPLTIETVPTLQGSIRFFCLGDISLWRARTLYSKEPETIEWIDTFTEGEVFWDVGANVGIYSLYAAVRSRVRVLAFEPGSANYALINRNIELNGLDGAVTAYSIAFSDRRCVDTLNMRDSGFGAALSSFGSSIDEAGASFAPKFRQGMIGYSIDQFIEEFDPSFPNHLKIDVDGIEDRIIDGASKTLADERVKTVSIELDSARPDHTDAVCRKITAGGLQFVSKRHAGMFDNGPYSSVYNYQFRRSDVASRNWSSKT